MPTAKRPRRTQEERRAETRGRLLDAAIASLLEVGYAATTTRSVAQRAGVSAGAQNHHFPRRVELVVAAVERLVEQRVAALRITVDELPERREERVRSLLDLLWSDFSSPLFTVYVKLWVAAADDRELYDRLVPLERYLSRAIGQLARELFAGEAAEAAFEDQLATALNCARGLALAHAFEPRARRPKDQWPGIRAQLERLVLTPVADGR